MDLHGSSSFHEPPLPTGGGLVYQVNSVLYRKRNQYQHQPQGALPISLRTYTRPATAPPSTGPTTTSQKRATVSNPAAEAYEKLHQAIQQVTERMTGPLNLKWEALAQHVQQFHSFNDSLRCCLECSELLRQTKRKTAGLSSLNEPLFAVLCVLLTILLNWLCKFQPGFRKLANTVLKGFWKAVFCTPPESPLEGKEPLLYLPKAEKLEPILMTFMADTYLGLCRVHGLNDADATLSSPTSPPPPATTAQNASVPSTTNAASPQPTNSLRGFRRNSSTPLQELNYWKKAYLEKCFSAWRMAVQTQVRIRSETKRLMLQNDELRQRIGFLEQSVQALRKEKEECNQQVQHMQAEKDNLESDVAILKAELGKVQEELGIERVRREKDAAELPALREQVALRSRVVAATQQQADELTSLLNDCWDIIDGPTITKQTLWECSEESLYALLCPTAKVKILGLEMEEDVLKDFTTVLLKFVNALADPHRDVIGGPLKTLQGKDCGVSFVNHVLCTLVKVTPHSMPLKQLNELIAGSEVTIKVAIIWKILQSLHLHSLPVLQQDILSDASGLARVTLLAVIFQYYVDPTVATSAGDYNNQDFVRYSKESRRKLSTKWNPSDWRLNFLNVLYRWNWWRRTSGFSVNSLLQTSMLQIHTLTHQLRFYGGSVPTSLPTSSSAFLLVDQDTNVFVDTFWNRLQLPWLEDVLVANENSEEDFGQIFVKLLQMTKDNVLLLASSFRRYSQYSSASREGSSEGVEDPAFSSAAPSFLGISVPPGALWKFCREMGLAHSTRLTFEDVLNISRKVHKVVLSQSVGGEGPEQEWTADDEITPATWSLALIRVAYRRFNPLKRLPAMFQELLDRMSAQAEKFTKIDGLCALRAHADVHAVLEQAKPTLAAVYKAYATKDSVRGVAKASLEPSRLVQLAKDLGIVNSVLTADIVQEIAAEVQVLHPSESPGGGGGLTYSEFLLALLALVVFYNPRPYEPVDARVNAFLEQLIQPRLSKLTKAGTGASTATTRK